MEKDPFDILNEGDFDYQDSELIPYEKKKLEIVRDLNNIKGKIIGTHDFLKNKQETEKLALDYLVNIGKLKFDFSSNLIQMFNSIREEAISMRDYLDKNLLHIPNKEIIERKELYKKNVDNIRKIFATEEAKREEGEKIFKVITEMMLGEKPAFIKAAKFFEKEAEEEKHQEEKTDRRIKSFEEEQLGLSFLEREEKIKERHNVLGKKLNDFASALMIIAEDKPEQITI